MNETDNLWNQLFQEEPVNDASLQSMKKEVMTQVLANPIDFYSKLLMAQRRKWGTVLLVVLLIAGLSAFGLIWFKGEWLLSFIPQAQGWLFEQEKLLSQLIIGLEYLWQLYVWPFLGISIAWVLFDGIRHKMLVRD